MKNQILNQQEQYYDSYLKIQNNPRYRKAWGFIEKSSRKGKLLDIGCTNGDFSEKLVKKGYDCYGLEFINKAVRESTRKGIKVKKASFLQRFPFRDNFFDFLFAGEVIEHTIDDKEFLRECQRVLKPGGILILTTPNLTSLGNRLLVLFGYLPRFVYSEFHYRIYTPSLLKSKLKESNFKVIKDDSSYILVSTWFNKYIGTLGEWLGTILPSLGEHIIIYAQKK